MKIQHDGIISYEEKENTKLIERKNSVERVKEAVSSYGNGEGLENGDSGLKNLLAAAHERDRGSMFAELGGNFESDSGGSTGD